MWRLAKIREFIYSKDEQLRSTKVLFANKSLITRAINHLFPLEINSQADCEELASSDQTPNSFKMYQEEKPLQKLV